MRNFKRILRFGLIGFLLTAGAGKATSMPLPQWPVDYVILKSELIVSGQIVDEHALVVDKVFLGEVSGSTRVDFSTHLELTVTLGSDCNRTTMTAYQGLPCRTVKGSPVVLFLTRTNPTAKWETTGWGSGVKWLYNGEAFGYYQFNNPGPYELLPEKRAPEDLYRAINDGLEKRSRYFAALHSREPAQRIDGLLPFVQDPRQYLYWREALFSLAATGPMAGESLRELAEKLKGTNYRGSVIEALGKTGDEDSMEYLKGIVSNGEPLMQKGGFQFVGPDDRKRMNEWKNALCALAEIGKPGALPAFRESIFDAFKVEEFYGYQAATCIEYGLNKSPSPENMPLFQRVLTRYPHWYGWEGSTRWVNGRALDFLSHHKFREALPVLVEQLDHPDAYTKQQAHQFLIEIAGQDLGWSKQAWLEWDKRYRPTSKQWSWPQA